MPTIYVTDTATDGWAAQGLNADWADARGGAGNGFDKNNARDAYGVLVFYTSRGGTSFGVRRGFLTFDTSGITSTVSSCTLNIRGYSVNSSQVIPVKANYTGLASANFNDIEGDGSAPTASTQLGNSDGSGAGTLASVSGLVYASAITSWSTSGYNSFTLNATALADLVSLSSFQVCLMDYESDFADNAPTSLGSIGAGMWWTEQSGTSYDPYLSYTLATVASTENATFFGANF